MKYAKRVAIVLVAVLLAVPLLGTPVACIVDRNARARTDEMRAAHRAQLERLRPRVLDDQRALASHWLFAPQPGASGDASTVLTGRVGWGAASTAAPIGVGVPAAYLAQLKEWGVDWATHVDDANLEGADLAWMKELRRFDHWDLEHEGSPVNQRPWRFHESPFPDFIPLQAVAKARLTQGMREGAPLEAVADVRALARLCASTESLLGEMIATAFLTIERKARLAAQARGLDVSAWSEVTEDEIQQVKRTLWGAVAFFQPLVLDVARVPGADEIKVGRCAALMESGANSLMMRQLVGSRYADRYRELGEAITSSTCRLKNLRRAWNATDGEGELQANSELFCTTAAVQGGEPPPGCGTIGAVLWLPYTKEAIGEILLSIATPSFLKYYEESPPAGP